MIIGNGDFYIVVAERECKLTIAPKLLVLPAFNIVVDRHTWEKLRYKISVVIVFNEVFVTRTRIPKLTVGNIVVPFKTERNSRSRRQWCWQVDAHHRLMHRIWQLHTIRVLQQIYFKTAIKFFLQEIFIDKARTNSTLGSVVVVSIIKSVKRLAITGTNILIELEPQIR